MITETIYTWNVNTAEALVLAAAVVTHPIVRLFTRVTTVIGAISATALLMRESKFARYGVYAVVACLGLLVMTGCAPTQAQFNGETVATTEVAPVSGVYCPDTLQEYQAALKEKLQCLDCDTPQFSALASAYDECVMTHKEDNFIVNPFNRIRGL